MPSRPDLPCADCGKLTWRGKGVLSAGQARCRECRYSQPAHGTRRMYRERGCRCDECREWNRVQMAAYVETVRLRDGISPTQKYRPSQNHRLPGKPGECSRCGAHLKSTYLDDAICARCRGNRPGYNIPISRADRLAIYERDGWTCCICCEPVDPDAPVNSTWDATLDHIVPRSKGGTAAPENLRLAHRWCNSVRNDLSYYNDSDLRIA